MQKEELLTVKEAATILHCSDQTIRTLLKEGKVKGFRFSKRKLLVDKQDIDKIRNTPAVF